MRLKQYLLKKPKRPGQGMLEFALALPVFLLLVLGVIEFGRLLAVVSSVTTAAREAARYGSASGPTGDINFQDCKGMRDAAMRVGFFAGVRDANPSIENDQYYIHIGYYEQDNSAALPDPITYAKQCVGDTSAYNYNPSITPRIVVKISVGFKFLFLGLPSFSITSQSARTIVSQVKMDVKGGTITPAPTWPPTPTSTATETLIPSLTPKHPTRTPIPPTPTGPTPTKTASPTATNTYTVTPTVFPCGFVKAGAGIITDRTHYGFRVYNSSGVSSIPYYPAQDAWVTRIDLHWSSRALLLPTVTNTPDPLATEDPNTPTPVPSPTATKTIVVNSVQFDGVDLPGASLVDPFFYEFGGAGRYMAPGSSASIDFLFNSIDTDTKLIIESASVLMQYVDPGGNHHLCLIQPEPLVQGN
jgi:hypothetical protein